MAKIEVDLRFVELHYELWGLVEFRTILEKQIAEVASQKTAETKEYLQKHGFGPGDGDYDLAMGELSETVECMLPRFYRGPFLVALWATFEAGVHQLANYIARKNNKALQLSDIRGRSTRDHWTKYFVHVLEYDLQLDDKTWEQLDEIRTLRHAMSHSNGRIAALNEDLRKKIEKWSCEKRGIQIYYEFIILSEAYLETSTKFIQELLHELVVRVENDFR